MRIWLLSLLLFLGGCGTAQRDTLRAYRDAFASGEYDKAQALLKKSELEKDSKSALLLLMERGRLNYAMGAFKPAADDFTAAIELIDKQYTKSVTREGSKWVINDASGEFFGAPYERSWLFYHQALAHWRIYQEGNLPDQEARIHLFAARAALLAWDTFFQEWQRSTDGKSLYRHDLTAKMVAAEVHEATGVRSDLQIALQLYKDAWKLLNTLGPAYPAFNTEASGYATSLEDALNDKAEFKTPEKNRSLTTLSSETRDLILYKIVSLTQSLRANELPQLPKQLGVTLEEMKAVNKKNGNVVFVLEEGVMPPKTAEEINLGIKGLASLSKDPKTKAQIEKVGSEVIAAFAVNVLGLVPKNNTDIGAYSGARAAMTLAAHEAGIAFEVPSIPKGESPKDFYLVIKDKDGKEIASKAWSVITHLEDVARQSLSEESGQRILRTGVRVAIKHVTAIIAAMTLYHSLSKGKEDNLLAKYAAIGSYVAATKGIAYSERADTRAWLTLPRTLRMTEFALNEGEYTAEIAKKTDEKTWTTLRNLGPLKVSKNRAIFTYLIPQL
ncbi:MAG: hypothetical protein K2P81_06925 [Bacteriovoracaceae bacterium]|nr:hypothetical protein [Bacteriovoracaceae bacterium]